MHRDCNQKIRPSEIPDEVLAAGMSVFEDWFAENAGQISEMGGCDRYSLLAALWDSWRSLTYSSGEMSSSARSCVARSPHFSASK